MCNSSADTMNFKPLSVFILSPFRWVRSYEAVAHNIILPPPPLALYVIMAIRSTCLRRLLRRRRSPNLRGGNHLKTIFRPFFPPTQRGKKREGEVGLPPP